MHCMRSSVGRIVIPSRHGATSRPLMVDSAHLLEQNIGPGVGAYTDNASSYCVHASLVASTLQALHSRARAR